MSHIFVSYKRESAEIVDVVIDDLKVLREDVWFDEEIAGGKAWRSQILERIRDSKALVFVIDSKSLESRACAREREYADALGKPILPVTAG